MNRSISPPGDRLVLATCAAIALLAVVVPTLLWRAHVYVNTGDGNLDVWLRTAIGLAPECAALAAVVLTRVRWSGVTIAVCAALLGSTVGVVFLHFDGIALGAWDVASWFGWSIVFGLPLLVADLVAQRVEGFSARNGSLTGALVGVTLMALHGLSMTPAIGSAMLGFYPAQFWLTQFLAPVVALVLTGALSGAAARARRRSADRPGVPVA